MVSVASGSRRCLRVRHGRLEGLFPAANLVVGELPETVAETGGLGGALDRSVER